jgi:streptogramin lyase/predicted Ser/Thr protein kinase
MPVGSDPLPGSEIAGFRLEELLGRGGMGAVYRAEDVRLGRKVALKLLVPELAESERFRERFLRESQVAASLDHPHIVPIYAAGDAEGRLFLAMRYVEGDDLRQLIAREAPLDPARALRLIEQVGDALDAAHERGLIHRDVKPANVLIAARSGREHCYLTDFGLTKQTSSISGLTGTGELVGTIEYVSPEQIRGERIDGRADVYSLGCVLYECLAGVRPFARESEVATLWAHVHEPPAPLRATHPELGDQIDGVMARALAKEPAERYESCASLVAGARAALGLEERPATTRRHGRRRLRLPRGRLRALVAASAAAIAVAAVAVVLLLRGSDGLSGIRPMSVGVIDSGSGELVADIPVGFESPLIAAGEGFVWALDPKARTLTTIDPKTMEVVETSGIPADGVPVGLTVGEGSVWVAVNQGQRLAVLQIGPELKNVRSTTAIHVSTSGSLSVLRETVVLTTGDDAVWALERGRGEVTRIDPATGKPKRLTDGYGASSSIAVGKQAIWLGGISGVNKIDPVTGSELDGTFVTGVIDSTATSIAIGVDATWFTANSRARLWRIPPEGNTVDDSFEVGEGPNAVAVDEAGTVWVVSGGDGSVSRLDPALDSPETIELGVASGGILVAFDRVWTSPGQTVRAG